MGALTPEASWHSLASSIARPRQNNQGNALCLLDKKDEVEEEYRPDSTEPHANLLRAQQALTGNATNPEKIPQ
jgi:hypothetical protein